MGMLSCCKCITESDVELVDIPPEYSNSIQIHKLKENYITRIEFDKNNRKIETRIYNEDCFTQLHNNMISEKIVYALKNPDQVLLRISFYDNGNFFINRYDFNIGSYVVIDEDNPMNCYFSKFIDNLANKKSDGVVYYSITNEKWMKELTNIDECPDYGFKIILSKKHKNCTFEIGRYVE